MTAASSIAAQEITSGGHAIGVSEVERTQTRTCRRRASASITLTSKEPTGGKSGSGKARGKQSPHPITGSEIAS
jgi:hypothetical protein